MPKATTANGTNGIEPPGAIHLTLQGTCRENSKLSFPPTCTTPPRGATS
jgi:hypothetical protein